MKKTIPFLLIVGGGFLILFSVWQIWQGNQLQEKAFQEAKSRIEQSNHSKEISADGTIEFHAEQGDKIGILKIPRLERELPIVYGVDEDELKQGVGHYPDTSYPGQNSQIVLSGHRDTVFRQFGELEIGDSFIVEMPYGNYEYVIKETKIVGADDRTIIDPASYDEEILTVTTCYPFHYIGNAPDRYIVYATPKNS